MRYYDFTERLTWSQGFLHGGIARILRDRIPHCYDVIPAGQDADRQGTDYWAKRHGLPDLSVDVKVRDEDYAVRGQDDLALETWSVVGGKIGWTRNPDKRTDYVLWFWQDTGRFFLVAFPPLCEVFSRYWQDWRTTYPTAVQTSGEWSSECVFVPRSLVIEKLTAWQSGMIREEPELWGM